MHDLSSFLKDKLDEAAAAEAFDKAISNASAGGVSEGAEEGAEPGAEVREANSQETKLTPGEQIKRGLSRSQKQE